MIRMPKKLLWAIAIAALGACGSPPPEATPERKEHNETNGRYDGEIAYMDT